MIRSESTKAFGQPSETKEMRGGRFIAAVHSMQFIACRCGQIAHRHRV